MWKWQGKSADDSRLGKYEVALNIFKAGVDERNAARGHGEPNEVYRRGFFRDFEPTHDLDKLCKQCMEKYPMITFMDDNHFGWHFTVESVKETINYVTMIEATYNVKKEINESKKNIFDCAEKLEKKALDKQPQLN